MKRARQKPQKVKRTRAADARIKSKKNRSKIRFSTVLKTMLITLCTLVVGLFVVLGFGIFDESDLLAPIDRESGKINALILGVDGDGLRTDTIMVASFDLDTAQVNMLSIPRDTKLYVTNRKMTRKITEIHAISTKDGKIAGPIGSSEAVSQLTGIPINYYVEFSFDAVENLLDTLGPITYDVPDVEGGGKGMNYEDPAQDLYIHLKPGVQELNGEQLVHLMRYRHGDSDYARMERQQNVIKAVVDQKLNLGLILKAPKIFSQLKKDISTNISNSDFAKYVQYLGELSSDKIHSYQLPGKSEKTGAWYFVCDIDATKTLISETFGYDASQITTKVEITAQNSNAKPISKKKTQEKKSTATQSPSKTKSPTVTKTPSATRSPSATKTPAKSPAPAGTTKPTETKTPAETQKPSTTPSSTSTPTPTPTPKAENDVISLD